VPFERSPLKINNLKAIKQLKKIINNEKFEIIHCHTPMGSVVTRLAAKEARKKYNTRVIYTAHGFHFYKGAPMINWIIYYPIEKVCSRWTDCLITINKEDYELAKKKFKAKQVEYVHGVGLDTTKFEKELSNEEKIEFRKSLGIKENDIVFSYVAELNKNKNQILLINTIKELKKEKDTIKLLLVGDGNLYDYYKEVIQKENLQDNVMLLGRRNDINEILSITDIYLASSLREGLPVNIMEAMYKGLPVIATDNRGHRELINNNENGFILGNEFNIKDIIIKAFDDNTIKNEFIINGKKVIDKYLIHNVIRQIEKIYFG
jgi:glycosyltransferase EpsD